MATIKNFTENQEKIKTVEQQNSAIDNQFNSANNTWMARDTILQGMIEEYNNNPDTALTKEDINSLVAKRNEQITTLSAELSNFVDILPVD